jgi:PAS domain S-box-containing protein
MKTDLMQEEENTLRPEMLTRLLHNLPGMAYRCNNDADWTMLFVSEGCHTLTGYHPLELLHNGSRSYEELIHPEDQQLVRDAVDKGVAEHRPFKMQYRIVNKEGNIVHVWEQGCAVYDTNGQVLFLDGLITDITLRVMVERALKEDASRLAERDRVKDAIFSIIAHDLQNPVYAIISSGEFVLRNYHNIKSDESLEFVSQMTSTAREMQQLLDNLVDWSRLKGGMLKKQFEQFKLELLVRECLVAWQSNIARKNITLDVDVPKSIVLNTDKNMLAAILRNILSNAIKYSKTGGRVEVIAKKEQAQVSLCIVDHGTGMTRNESRNVFDITKRVKRLGTAYETGSGLGLTLAADFAKCLNISIDLESKVNRGTQFTLSIPSG